MKTIQIGVPVKIRQTTKIPMVTWGRTFAQFRPIATRNATKLPKITIL